MCVLLSGKSHLALCELCEVSFGEDKRPSFRSFMEES